MRKQGIHAASIPTGCNPWALIRLIVVAVISNGCGSDATENPATRIVAPPPMSPALELLLDDGEFRYAGLWSFLRYAIGQRIGQRLGWKQVER